MATGSKDVHIIEALGFTFAAGAFRDLRAGLYETNCTKESKGSFTQNPFHDEVSKCRSGFA